MRGTLEQRFWAKVSKRSNTECWLWTGSHKGTGYGYIRDVGRKTVPAHRISYLINVGPIPDGLHIDHLCRVRHCVNPTHLEPVTCKENVVRGHVARGTKREPKPGTETGLPAHGERTHCPQGHPYDLVNTYWNRRRSDGRLRRSCRICAAEASRRYYERQKALSAS